MFYTKRMAELFAMDTPKRKTNRRKYYWYLLELGGLITNWDPRYYIWTIAYLIVQLILGFYFLICFLVSVFKAVNLMGMCVYLNLFALLMLSTFMLIVTILLQEKLLIFTSVADDAFYEYGNSLTRTEEIRQMNENAAKMRKMMFIIAPSWISLVALSIMLSDLVDVAFSYPASNETVINGIDQRLPCKMWIILPIDNIIVRLLTILAQGVCFGGAAVVIGTADLIMFFSGQTLVIQLKILNMAVLDTDKRAAKLYETNLGRKPPSEPSEKSKDLQLMGFYEFCLKQTVEHHCAILRYVVIYSELINWPGGLMVINGSIVVAMSMLSLMQGGGQPSVLITSCLLIVAEVASIFMVCEVGETVTDQCRELFDSMYQFKWMDCSAEIGKSINIMKSYMIKRPIVLTAGSLTPIDRNTFGAMMNTAYSYMNLVMASGAVD
uniref:Odorant receptor n=1 Tax=Adelphocoris lineolatus TaxID=236346 RepID=A0A2I4PHF3_ADELI|nr:olfactory receptor 46 [Adelphocoris lineolatus]